MAIHGDHKSPEYEAWCNIVQRCSNKNHPCYEYYGGRGIVLCAAWRDYTVFIKDVGRRPSPKHSIERIDNDKSYEPSNVRWATRGEQMRNTRRTRLITFNGKTQCLKDWAYTLGIPPKTLQARIVDYGWSVEEAFAVRTRPRPQARLYEFRGEKKTLLEWAKTVGIDKHVIELRLSDYGWTLERALTTLPRAWHRRTK